MTIQSTNSNHLIHATSPYLLQHAHNPVDWYPWGKEALDKAENEDKPILVSIGYSACHWCHVMEHECFENEDIARLMNECFVCIKVDREERPDVDQIYMDAIQTMGLNGGWPLNVFTMPNQKPFYGGTYFPPQNWIQLLKSIANAYENKRDQLTESAQEFAKAIAMSESEKFNLTPGSHSVDIKDVTKMFTIMKGHFDEKLGGLDRAPKFPNPSIWNFLLTSNAVIHDPDIETQIKLTLDSMANGGIYDHIGGGFARYAVDDRWFAPHFEKMLYDNAQLVSLYAAAYRAYGINQYKHIVKETIDFVVHELMDDDGGFYSALDADSEGEEGKYYVWQADEIRSILKEKAELFMAYFNISETGNWENGKNILYKNRNIESLLEKWKISREELEMRIGESVKLLLNHRQGRQRPGLDDKILTAWNGLMLKGLVDAYMALGDQQYLDLALKSASFITSKLTNGQQLFRTYKKGHASLNAYLEDYAFVIQGLLALYEVTFDEAWLEQARELLDYSIYNFYDTREDLFFYTDQNAEALIARKKEIFDNVIPASNSAMAMNLFIMSKYYDNSDYLQKANSMLSKILPLLCTEPQYLTNWGTLSVLHVKPIAEVAIVGEKALAFSMEISKHFFPNIILAGTTGNSEMPLLHERQAINGKTTVYVCFNKTCKLPVKTVEEALKQIPV